MGLAGSIFTVLLSGVVAALVSFVLNATKDEFWSSQRKVEELFRAFVKFDKQMQSFFFAKVAYLAQKLDRDQMNDMILDNRDDKQGEHYDTVEMLIRFYFPDLIPVWSKYLEARDNVNKLGIEAERDRSKKASFDRAVLKFGGPSDALRDAIVRQGQQYAKLNLVRRATEIR